jgi:hypothetical protein
LFLQRIDDCCNEPLGSLFTSDVLSACGIMKRRDFNAWVSEVVTNVIVLVHHSGLGTEKRRARKLHDFQGVGFKSHKHTHFHRQECVRGNGECILMAK